MAEVLIDSAQAGDDFDLANAFREAVRLAEQGKVVPVKSPRGIVAWIMPPGTLRQAGS